MGIRSSIAVLMLASLFSAAAAQSQEQAVPISRIVLDTGQPTLAPAYGLQRTLSRPQVVSLVEPRRRAPLRIPNLPLQPAFPEDFLDDFNEGNPGLGPGGGGLSSQVTSSVCGVAARALRIELGDRTVPRRLVVDAFDAACLRPAGSLPAALAGKGVNNLVGILVGPDGGFCSATRLLPDKLVTARHCFYKKQDNRSTHADDIPTGEISFHLLGNLDTPYVVKRLIPNPHYAGAAPVIGAIPHDKDIVFLEVENLGAVAMPDMDIALPTAPAPLATVGLFSYAVVANGWRSAIRWSSGETCRTAQVNGQCIYHGCNTTRGFSGGPLFAVTAGLAKPTLVGIHVDAGSERESCLGNQDRSSGNIGAASQSDWRNYAGNS